MKYEHIGKIIRQKFDESGMNKEEFTALLCKHRTTAYYLFKRDRLDIETLELLSEIFNFDFIYEVYRYKKQENIIALPTPQTVFIAVEIAIEKLQQLNLPDDFIRFLKEQK